LCCIPPFSAKSAEKPPIVYYLIIEDCSFSGFLELGVLDGVSAFYAKAENKFFDLCDWAEAKGIPVYNYTNFLESKGIPAFPFTIALLLVLIVGIAALGFIPAASQTTLELSILDTSNNALSGVDIKVLDNSRELFRGTKSNGGTITLSGVAGKELSIVGTKEGYSTGSARVTVRGDRENVLLELEKPLRPILARIRFVDSKTNLPIANADVSLSWENLIRTGQTDANGFFSVQGLPEGEDVRLQVTSDNYEQLDSTVRFLDGQIRSIPLEPKNSAQLGNASLLVRVFDKETSAPLSDAQIEIINPQSEDAYFSGFSIEGEYSANLPKGTVFVVKVSKGGFVSFVSTEQTLREDPTLLTVELAKGGNRVRITTQSAQSGLPLAGTRVALYRPDETLVEEQTAAFSGSVEFAGLNPDENYFASAYLAGYVPQSVLFSPLSTSEFTMELEPESESNTAELNLFVTGADGLAGNNANISFFEIISGIRLPLGLPVATTEYDGYATVKVPVGRNVLTRAERGLEIGDANRFITAGENNLAIRMDLRETAKRLRVLGIDGNPLPQGLVLIETQTGEILLDANLFEDGTQLFDAKTAEVVNITVTVPDGNRFTSQENVKGRSEILIRLSEPNSNSIAPVISFLGIENAQNESVSGLTPGTDYWLKFQIDWASGDYRGGVHVRLGNDSAVFADSDDAGVTGFDASNVSSFAYGRSFSPLPTPGNEALDLRNKGAAGEFNKWVELYFEKPSGTQVIRVKVRAKEIIEKKSVFVHYRAWALVGTAYYRTPADAELAGELFSQTKTALYAQTLDESVPVFSQTPECSSEVCAVFQIVSSDNQFFSKSDFAFAVKGRVYAIETRIKSSTALGGLLKATTPRQTPKLFFTGTEVESFTGFLDSNTTLTEIEINDISVLENAERKARIYFKPVQEGSASIRVDFIWEGDAVFEEFFFNVTEDRELFVTLEPAVVRLGEPFKVLVKDAAGNPVTNATVHIRDRLNAIVDTVLGNGSSGKGSSGEYSFGTSIGAGQFSAEATAPGFSPKTVSFDVASNDVFNLPEEIVIRIPPGQTAAESSIDLVNRSGTPVRDIGIEVLQNENWPASLRVNAGTVSSLRENQTGKIDFSVSYSGDQNAIVIGEAEVVVRGFVSGKFPAIGQSHLVVSYNQALDRNCLSFDQKQLVVFLAANAASPGVDSAFSPDRYYAEQSRFNAPYSPQFSNPADRTNYNQFYQNAPDYSSPNQSSTPYSSPGYSSSSPTPYSRVYEGADMQQKEIELQVTNNCGVALNLRGDAVPKGGSERDAGIQVTVPPIMIQPNETQTTTIAVANTRSRVLSQKEERNFDLVYSYNPSITSLPLKVVLWDSRFALAMQDNFVLFLSQGTRGEAVIAQQPVFVRNIGLEPIENFNLRLGGDTIPSGVDLRIVPSGDVPVLGQNQVLFPPKVLVAEIRGGSDKGRLGRAELIATGIVGGREVELKRANVWVHVSALECMRISAVESLDFISQESRLGTIDKKIRIRNTCEEPVRIADVQPNKLGANEFALVTLTTDTLDRDAEAEFLVRLAKRQDYKSQNLSISVAAFTLVSRKFIASNRLPAIVELGQAAVSTGIASEPFSVSVCNADGTASAQKVQIRFPKISTTANCDKGYCDAENAVEFLLKRLDNKVSQAQSAIAAGNREVINFSDNCIVTAQTPACTFGQFDPKIPETFDLFLQNDRVTAELLQKEIQDKSFANLKNYSVNYCAGPNCNVQAVAATGFPNLLMVSDNFAGCGRYRVSIDGAAFVNGTVIQTDGFALAVNVQSVETTPECQSRIENVHNFLPLDKSLSVDSPYSTWLGVAEGEDKLLPLVNAFAKEFFEKSEGRVASGFPTSRISVETGEFTGGIVKVAINPTSAQAQPQTVTATVNRTIENVDLIKNPDSPVVREAAAAIGSLKSQRIGDNKGCISPDHDYFVLGSPAKLGELSVTGPATVDVLPNAPSCVELVAQSELKESVQLKTNAADVLAKSNAFSGIEVKSAIDGSVLSETDAVALDEDPKTKTYSKKFQVCVTGSPQFQFSTTAPKLLVTAQSTVDSVRQSKEKEIAYRACGIHPYDLVNLRDELDPAKEYYATVGWKGDPNSIPLNQLVDSMNKANLMKSGSVLDVDGTVSAAQPEIKAAVKRQALAAIWGWAPGSGFEGLDHLKSYVPWCMAASATCNGFRTVGVGGALVGPVFDCLIPAVWATAPHVGGLKEARAYMEKAFGSTVGKIAGKVADFFQDPQDDAVQQDLIDSATGSIGIHSILRGVSYKVAYGRYTTPLPIKSAASQITNEILDAVVKEQMVPAGTLIPGGGIVTEADEAAFRMLITEELKPEIEKALRAKSVKSRLGKIIPPGDLLNLGNEKAIAEATAEGITAASAKLELNKKVFEFALDHPTSFKEAPKLAAQSQLAAVEREAFEKTIQNINPTSSEAAAIADMKTRIVSNLQSLGLAPGKTVEPGRTVQTVVDDYFARPHAITVSKVPVPNLPARAIGPYPEMFKVESGGVAFDSILNEIGSKNPSLWGETVLKNARKETLAKASEFTKKMLEGKTGKVGRFTRLRKFVQGMSRGILCGAAANAAGIGFWKAGVAEPPKLEPNQTQTQVTAPVGGLLENGKTYKITLEVDPKDKNTKRLKLSKVSRLEDIPKNTPAAQFLNKDCTGQFAQKGLGEILNADALKSINLQTNPQTPPQTPQ